MANQPNTPKSRQDKIAAATPKQKKTTPIIAALIVLVVIVGVAWAVMSGRDSENADAGASGVPKGSESASGGIVIGAAAEGAPRLDIYEDPQCPWCAVMHGRLGQTVVQLAETGQATVVVHVKTFMDSNLRNDASKRSANGMMCAADLDKFLPYHDLVLENQSQEGKGWTDAQLEQFAKDAGITGDDFNAWQACQQDETYNAYLAAVEEATARDGVTGTPLYRINGEELPLTERITGAELEAAIAEAGGAAPGASASN